MYRSNRGFTALTLGFALLAACDDRNTPVEPKLSDVPTGAQAAAAETAPVEYPHEAEFHRLSKEIEGYGGHFFDEQGNLVVYLADAAQQERARRLLEPVLASRPLSARQARLAGQGTLVVRKADFSFAELARWRDYVTHRVLTSEGVEFTDLDERQNRVVVGVTDMKGRMAAARALREQAVPSEAIVFEQTSPAQRYQITLRHHFRPLRGGFQIATLAGRCTLGFNLVHNGQPAFLTNSHCTSSYMAPDGTQFYQPTASDANLLGPEISDPNTFHRWSDAAVIRRNAGVSGDLGYIARTTFAATGPGNEGSIVVSSSSPRMRITGELAYPTAGQELDKVGQRTGWTYGNVYRACVNHDIGGGRTLRCQDWVEPMHAWHGDSGSPIFRWDGGTVTLAGILWGGITEGSTTYTVFSAMSNIRADHGAMTTF